MMYSCCPNEKHCHIAHNKLVVVILQLNVIFCSVDYSYIIIFSQVMFVVTGIGIVVGDWLLFFAFVVSLL
jgi:hypothetical protein